MKSHGKAVKKQVLHNTVVDKRPHRGGSIAEQSEELREGEGEI